MSNLAEDLFQQLQGAPLEQVSRQLGLGQMQTTSAVSAALPLLLGALGRNASQPQGAQALFGALQKDHAGLDIGGVLGAALGGGGGNADGVGRMLGHIFGSQQGRAVSGLGEATGLGVDKSQQLLRILAPIVMAFLAKRVLGGNQQQSASPDVLGQILGQERNIHRQQGGLSGGLLGAVLDQDGDGKLGLGDLLKVGAGMMRNR